MKTRLRGISLLLGVTVSAAVVLVSAGPAAASNLYCGENLDASVTLIGSLDCSGYAHSAIVISGDNVTLNLNGFSITAMPGHDAIRNFVCATTPCTPATGTLIKNGTLNIGGDGGIGVDNSFGGGNDLTLDVVDIVGDGSAVYSTGVDSENSSGLTVIDGSISGVKNGIWLGGETGDLVKNVVIMPSNYNDHMCAGVYETYGTTSMIVGNAFSDYDPVNAGNTCYGLRTDHSAGTQFTGNAVTGMLAGVRSRSYSAGLAITSNVMDGNVDGVELAEYDSGDLIAGNFIKNSAAYGITDVTSFDNTYNGNILTSNGSSGSYPSYYIDPGTYGPVTMVNNYARLGYDAGFWIEDAYTESVSGPPYSSFVGNNAIGNGTDGAPGFYDEYSVGSTWSANTAYANANDGFYFNRPWREIITNNTSKVNGDDGFLFYDVFENAQPLAVTDNSATYNGGYGFSGWDDEAYIGVSAYPVSGSGNTGGGTNGYADCYLVAGCS